MARLVIKNWRDFQHYKDRNPTWIKLHKRLLDDYVFHRLPLASRALAPMLWLISSESQDGSIEYDIEMIAFRLRCGKTDVIAGLNPLIDNDFIQVEQDASGVLAESYPSAMPEKRREETYKPEREKKTLMSNEKPFDGSVPESQEKQPKANEAEKQAVTEVWDYYLTAVDRKANMYEFTPMRKRKGLARLRECLRKTGGDYPKAVELMKLCVNAMCASDHHMGRSQSSSGKRYVEWEKHLFATQEQLEKWLMANDEAIA